MLKNLFDVIHESLELSTKDEIFAACKLISDVQTMSGGAVDTLFAMYEKGPLFDGDVPSKVGRDELLQLGMSCKIVIRKEDGYNACNYVGARAYRLIKAGARSDS